LASTNEKKKKKKKGERIIKKKVYSLAYLYINWLIIVLYYILIIHLFKINLKKKKKFIFSIWAKYIKYINNLLLIYLNILKNKE